MKEERNRTPHGMNTTSREAPHESSVFTLQHMAEAIGGKPQLTN
jgi:hypothetical protein